MAAEDDRELARERHENQMAILREIKEQVKETNGRTRVLEAKVAVLEANSPANPHKVSALGGTIGAGIVGGVALLLEWLRK